MITDGWGWKRENVHILSGKKQVASQWDRHDQIIFNKCQTGVNQLKLKCT